MILNGQNITTGAARINDYLPLIIDKEIAIVGNQTSIINNTHIVDTLLSLNIKIKKYFLQSMDLEGNEDAGALIENDVDSKTNLPIISLYGKNKTII